MSDVQVRRTEDLRPDEAVATASVVGDKLRGRVALVTGGTRGIGAAICRSLATQGAAVAAGYSGKDEAADRFRQSFPEQGVSVHKGTSAPEMTAGAPCRR